MGGERGEGRGEGLGAEDRCRLREPICRDKPSNYDDPKWDCYQAASPEQPRKLVGSLRKPSAVLFLSLVVCVTHRTDVIANVSFGQTCLQSSSLRIPSD